VSVLISDDRFKSVGGQRAATMGPAVRFWLLMLALSGTVSAAILLVVSAFLPGAVLGEADTVGYVVSVFVALVSLALLVWSLTADTEGRGSGRPG
jgi:VIT1/CCC1 family predicted Fe2+/Mn2+ transporter